MYILFPKRISCDIYFSRLLGYIKYMYVNCSKKAQDARNPESLLFASKNLTDKYLFHNHISFNKPENHILVQWEPSQTMKPYSYSLPNIFFYCYSLFFIRPTLMSTMWYVPAQTILIQQKYPYNDVSHVVPVAKTRLAHWQAGKRSTGSVQSSRDEFLCSQQNPKMPNSPNNTHMWPHL